MIRAADKWLRPYLLRPHWHRPAGTTHVILSVCDHFEPLHGTDRKGALGRIEAWAEGLRALQAHAAPLGLCPRQTFFYPIEQYDPGILERLAGIVRANGCEVEVHLHHDRDTAEGLRAKLRQGIADLRSHGLLGSGPDGQPCYGFIHGNWALDDSGPGGRGCGVPDELGVLKRTGCYGDFTMPSAPHPTQARVVNSLYYAQDTPEPRSHDRGERAEVGRTVAHRGAPDRLLLVQGPLALNWRKRKLGILPRIENGDLTARNPPTLERWRLWLEQGIHVKGRPDWVFVKLHTHGALPQNANVLLGDPARRFLADLADSLAADGCLRLHWVTARQMVNLIHAAEDGIAGDPSAHLDHLYLPPPLLGGK